VDEQTADGKFAGEPGRQFGDQSQGIVEVLAGT
jgi:hypothetical protein